MAVLPLINLWDGDKLEILRRIDQYRNWRSLDEKRYCIVCGSIITGRELQVVGGTRETGPLRLICPTKQCHSIPMDWVLPPDEVLVNEVAAPRDDRSYPAGPDYAA